MNPFGGPGEGETQFDDDSVGAIGVLDFLDVVALEFDYLRFGFDGDDFGVGHVAGIAQHAVPQ